LVHKSQEWAQVQSISVNDESVLQNDINKQEVNEQKKIPDGLDLSIMQEVERLMEKEKIYQDGNLSIDSLANMLKMKKYNVSEAINRCTGRNFSTYINEYRIKVAIRRFSDKESKTYSIDGIALELGFNDYTTFYRAFKKATGLSPTDFRRNLEQ